jgi:hypothetical protein
MQKKDTILHRLGQIRADAGISVDEEHREGPSQRQGEGDRGSFARTTGAPLRGRRRPGILWAATGPPLWGRRAVGLLCEDGARSAATGAPLRGRRAVGRASPLLRGGGGG